MQSPLIGNKRAWNLISSMITNKKIPHAILIEGEQGLGKKTLANFIAKACLCSEAEPCLNCKTCHLIDIGSHPDMQTILPDGAAIKVEQIRQLRVEAFMTPLAADGRVFVIDTAHLMNPAAQNAFLKVLEEPPKGVTFILLAKSASLLLETIRSRCVCFTLSPIAIENDGAEVVSKKANISFEDAMRLLAATDGNIGAAITAADGETVLISNLANEILTLAACNNKLKILNLLQPYVKDRAKANDIIFELKNAIARELKKKAMKEHSSFTANRLNYCYNELSDMQTKLEFNPSLPLIYCRIAALLTD